MGCTQTYRSDEHGRLVSIREWHNRDGQLHRATGPAWEVWTVLPGGAHVLSFQGWYVNGGEHREGRPAMRQWHVGEDGTRVVVWEEWARHDRVHRVGGPSYRCLTVPLSGTRTLAWVRWDVNGKLHRVDGPAVGRHDFYWHGEDVKEGDLPWLRRRQGLYAAFEASPAGPEAMWGHPNTGSGGASPAWSRDTRMAMTGSGTTAFHYCSVIGGSVLLCV